jgi:hypothetical protein
MRRNVISKSSSRAPLPSERAGKVAEQPYEALFSQSNLVTPRDLVILDGELIRYFWSIYQDEKTDLRTKFLAATKLAEISKECRRSLELTELETRLDRIEALITSLRTRADGIDTIQGKQLGLIQALYDHISCEDDEDTR